MLFEAGVEHGTEAEGMGEWPGKVELLPAEVVPHMGWNTVKVPEGSRLFDGVENERFYFVHSYGVQNWDFDVDPAAGWRRPWLRGPSTAPPSSPPWRTARSAPPSSTRKSPVTPAHGS